jgi:hypothetical protein
MSKSFNKIKHTGILGIDSQLTFGRHIGYTIKEILKDRPEYINWLMHNTELKFHQSVHEEIFRWLAKKDTPTKCNLYSPYGYLLDYDIDQQDDWLDDVPF